MKKKCPRIVERKLGRERAWGQAIAGEHVCEIDPRHRSELDRLDTLLHELLHLCQPDLSEKKIKVCSAYMARGLWQQDYRRVRL